jgi:hypothetical protein
VTNATGVRSVYRGGASTPQVLDIVGVAPPNTYQSNDNIVELGRKPFDNVGHGLTFAMSGQPDFAMGPADYNPSWVAISNWTKPLALGAGITEPSRNTHHTPLPQRFCVDHSCSLLTLSVVRLFVPQGQSPERRRDRRRHQLVVMGQQFHLRPAR